MKTNLRIELYKFIHQKNGLWGLLVLPLLMIYSGQTTRLSSQLITFEFGAPQWITLILIAVGSAFLSMEYRYRTIVPLVYKSTSKRAIYGAKLIVILGYGLLLTVVSALITMILKPIFTGDRYPWTPQLVQTVLINNTSTLLYSFFLITLAFMLLIFLNHVGLHVTNGDSGQRRRHWYRPNHRLLGCQSLSRNHQDLFVISRHSKVEPLQHGLCDPAIIITSLCRPVTVNK